MRKGLSGLSGTGPFCASLSNMEAGRASGKELVLESGRIGRGARVPVTPILMAWAAHLIGESYRAYQLDWRVLVKAHIAAAELLGIDQVSSISDPWREADALGAKLTYPEEGVGQPHGHLLQGELDPVAIPQLDPMTGARTWDRIQAVRGLAEGSKGRWSVLGWVEGPFAELCDLRDLQDVMTDLYDCPELVHEALELILENQIRFAMPQIEAGADTIGIGDAAASLISPEQYEEFVFPYESRLIQAIHDAGAQVKLHICGNTTKLIPQMVRTGANVVDIDWMVDLDMALNQAGGRCAIAGNFDPVRILKNGTPQTVRAEADRLLDLAEGRPFILQPGCEVPPGTPLENVLAFCPAGQGSPR